MGAFVARLDDGAADAPGMALLAEDADDAGKLLGAGAADDIRRARAGLAHAHVERTVEAEREAALRLVDLHGGHADIEHHAIGGDEAGGAGERLEVGEAALDQRQPPAARGDERGARLHRARVAVDRQHAAAHLQDGARIAAGAEGAVDVAATLDDGEVVESLGQEDGRVAGQSASTLRGGAARAHAPSPLP